MLMLSIQHPYLSVAVHGGASYGGGQQFSENAMIRRCGCGIVAATDLLLYLSRWHMTERVSLFDSLLTDAPVPFPAYTGLLSNMNRRYLPMIPYAGINGLMLMLGVQRFFHDYKMPFTARWCFAQSRLWERMEAMLRADIPVIMAVGPNFPFIWGNKRAAFYQRIHDGAYVRASGARAHYFTATGMDDEWLRISSWGRLYYLKRREFEEYVHRYSTGFASNILLVEKHG